MWRAVGPGDRAELSRLDGAIKRHDGVEAISDRVAGALSADAAICACIPGGALIAVGHVTDASFSGGVDPTYRRRGLGSRLLQWAQEQAPTTGVLTIRNEALTPDAHALYLSHGFHPQMVETRMVRDGAAVVPGASLPVGVQTLSWSADRAPLFVAAYRASFSDRPGFPDPPAHDWIADHDGEAFQPNASLVAWAAGKPAGFITAELKAPNGWIDQLGVSPDWRRRGLAGGLLTETLRQFRAADVSQVMLHVNVNNPGATALFTKLGFRADLQRARYTSSAG